MEINYLDILKQIKGQKITGSETFDVLEVLDSLDLLHKRILKKQEEDTNE